ncbi:unnamed protein product [Caenorhabditis auriculariae]|uniref:alpha-1,2-Mannosidase n=1 Tax=Caenorhabditis auriculariae TaxID=2777116 RepID=A0A8S1HKV4_9PELO|nr:unnamed protein product [Caenorhabditis auriculariae]
MKFSQSSSRGCAMQTVRFNRQAVLALVGCFVLTLCLIGYISSGDERSTVVSDRGYAVRPAAYQITQKAVEDVAGVDAVKEPIIPVVRRPEIKPEVKEDVPEPPKEVGVKLDAGEVKDDVSADDNSDVNLDDLIGKRHYVDGADENDKRRQKVKEMMLHAWNGYKNYSWGANELRPIAKTANSQNIFGGNQMPATIIDAADTLFIMDLMDEYREAHDYIKANFTMTKATGTLSVFETTIRFLGGLLSLYGLTREQIYLEKAKEVGEALLPAFKTPSGVPKSNLDVQRKYASNYGWANGGSSILAEFGSLHLEFTYLSRMTKVPLFEKKVKKIRDVLDKAEKPDGLYPNYMSPDSGKFVQTYHMSVGALGDSFYEYLIKSWLMSNKTDIQAKKMYWDVSEAIVNKMLGKSEKSGLTYTAELRGTNKEHKMGHLACFVVGMFGLQAVNEIDAEKKAKTMNLAEELGKTCHESYIRSETHIGPEMFYFNANDEATSRRAENGYILRPEVIEGFFYLWRLTGKTMYRDWVWDAVQAIDKYCRVDAGFAGLQNVYDPNRGHDDVQQSFFLAETLKYAYLTFADISLISLDQWVFNTEAHPFPVLSR